MLGIFYCIRYIFRFDAAISERLLLLSQLATYGASVFRDQVMFTRWLRRPLRLPGERSPLDSPAKAPKPENELVWRGIQAAETALVAWRFSK